MPKRAQRALDKRAQYGQHLAIDRDDLDTGLLQQPEIYYHVADAHAVAVAERDAIKLEIDNTEAEEYKVLREEAELNDRKVTEAQLKYELQLVPKLRELRAEFLEAKAMADRWHALQESFVHRRDMLKALVPMHLSRLSGGSVAASTDQLLEQRQTAISAERARRRK